MLKEKISISIISSILFLSFGFFSAFDFERAKYIAFFAIIASGIYLVFNKKPLTKTFACMSLYFIVCGISTLYANSGKFAINEFIKIIIAFSFFALISHYKKKSIDLILWSMTSLSAVISFITIEGATINKIAPIFRQFFYKTQEVDYAIFDVVRITSIFGNSNVFATMIGVTLFLSLYLYMNGKTWSKNIQAFYLILTAHSFWLALSLGSIACLAGSVFISIFFCPKKDRINILVKIIEVILISLISMALTITIYTNNIQSIIPLINVLVFTIIFIKIDEYFCDKTVKFITKNNKIMIMSIALMFFTIVFAVFYAFNETTEKKIEPGNSFLRVLYLEPGMYTIDIENDDMSSLKVYIDANTEENVILNTTSRIVSQDINGIDPIEFVIGEEVEEVAITILNVGKENDVVIQKAYVTSSNEEVINIPLNYKYIPENVIRRVQDIYTNNSFRLRQQFVKDGLELFLSNPILGNGLGGFENAIQSVQKYQYETKYAHNHFVQLLVDGGIIMFISYILLLCSCILALFKMKNQMSCILMGSLSMIILHGANEFSMSLGQFLPFAYGIFGLISVFDDDIILEKYQKISIVPIMGIFGVLLTGNIYANNAMKSETATIKTLETCAKIDVYEKNDYMLSYVLSTAQVEDEYINKTAKYYLTKLEKAKSNSISIYLTDYYLNNGDLNKAFEQVNSYIDYSKYDPKTWNTALKTYFYGIVGKNQEQYFNNKEILENINYLVDKFHTTNNQAISDIILDDEIYSFLRFLYAVEDFNFYEEYAQYCSITVYDSLYDTKINENKVYDAQSVATTFDINKDIPQNEDIVEIKVPFDIQGIYKITVMSDVGVKIYSQKQLLEIESINGGYVAYFNTETYENLNTLDIKVQYDGKANTLSKISIERGS